MALIKWQKGMKFSVKTMWKLYIYLWL